MLKCISIERGSTASFLSCGVQSHLEGVSKNADQLHYATEQSFKKQGINVHMNSDVVGIDPAGKTITVRTENGEWKKSYDKLFSSLPRSQACRTADPWNRS
ncbi:MAG: hypothetical protein U5K84_10120 [Alkalibacterium sp.]|nr:hypothetical protein [Alkalibacterium sp.]